MSDSEKAPGLWQGPRPRQDLNEGNFDASYLGTPPWDIGAPQPAVVELVDQGVLSGLVLDMGCGTGEHGLLAAERGHEATGVDSSPRAIAIAKKKAGDAASPSISSSRMPSSSVLGWASSTRSSTRACSTCSTTSSGRAMSRALPRQLAPELG